MMPHFFIMQNLINSSILINDMDTSYTQYSQEDMPNILIDLVSTNMILFIGIISFIILLLLFTYLRGSR